MSKHTLQPQPPRGPGYRHARGMCVDSAVAVAKILGLYENQFRLRHIHHSAVHITSSAALLLLFADVCSCPDWRHQEIIASLSTCFRALTEFAESWQSARQALNALLEIQQKWHSRKVVDSANRQSQIPLDTPAGTSGVYDAPNDLPFDNNSLMMDHGEMMQNGLVFDPDFDWSLMHEYQDVASTVIEGMNG